ncbi:hypothetical protein TIFTF001_012960 [Ficus carica]|uniref:F-box domain-containing protein n=1 Tax=Ficus carica TaxID=3494 RepID=A0AA88AGW9_FICCA|nr:hypothetical protein TIFTF001_012960 [Ficus carica]
MDKLPTDLILVIFSKLPLKTLLGLNRVCKSWSRIIDGRDLAKLHLNGGVEQPRILHLVPKPDFATCKPYKSWVQDGSIMEICSSIFAGIKRQPTAYVLESSCNGILCFKKRNFGLHGTAYLLNPFKQEALELPALNFLREPGLMASYGLGFDGTTSRYKIVCIVTRLCKIPDKAQACFNYTTSMVYTLGESSSWRALSNHLRCPVYGKSVFASGILYWVGLTKHMDGNYLEHNDEFNKIKKIVAFDVAKEEFRLRSCPGPFRIFHLVDLKGVLGVVDCSSRSHLEIWTLRDYERENWVKEYRIEIRAPNLMHCTHNGIEVIGLWKEGELLLRHSHCFVSYNPKNDKLEYIRIPCGNPDTDLCSFTGSLVSLSAFQADRAK